MGQLLTMYRLRMKVGDITLCQLLCQPPTPSAIVTKFTFVPPEPSYDIREEQDTTKHGSVNEEKIYQLHLHSRVRLKKTASMLSLVDIDVRLKKTKEFPGGIAIIRVRNKNQTASNYHLLCSHGNSIDIGLLLPYLIQFATTLKVHVYSYDYPGYGASPGPLSHSKLYKSIHVAYKTMKTVYKVPPSSIVLYGSSIGSVPTIALASKCRVAGVVLHAALLSAFSVVFSPYHSYCCDVFDGKKNLKKITAPVLVIHGKQDEIIPYTHGQQIHKHCRNKVSPLYIENGRHNYCEDNPLFLKRIAEFLNVELPKLADQAI